MYGTVTSWGLMADGRAFAVLLSLLLFYWEKHNIDPKYITNVKLLDANLVNEVNSNVNRGSIAFIQQIHSTVQTRLNFKRLGFLKGRLNYYANCTSSYNPSIITITQSGDIHPLPGPAQREYCTDIRCLYMNARSVINKINEFQTLAVEVDCIFAAETWLKSHILNCELLPGFDFTIYRRDRLNRTGGGVLFAVRNEIKSLRRKDLEGNAEILACELRPDSRRKILAIVFYRPPDTNRDYLKELKKTLPCASDAHFDQILLCGDFNLPNIDWSSGTAISHDVTHNDLAKLLKDHFMWQMVDFPTRGNNILGLIVTSVPEKVSNVVGFDDILSTDHKLISFELNLRILRKPKIKRAVYNFKKADWVGLNETLRHTPWDMCFVPNDVDSSLSNWCDFFTSAINAHIPKCLIKNVHNHPWIDAELLSMLRQKNIMRRKANKTGSINDNVKFQSLRKSVKQLITQKKREHGCKLKESIKNNPKRFWSYVKTSTRDKASPHLLRDGQVFVTDRVVKANKLNSFFHSVFSPEETFTQHSNTESIYSSTAQLPEICVTESEVAKVLKGIDPNKACGPDNIPRMLLFKTADAIAPSLCRLFNQSLSEGCVPLIWKCANIVPVHKNDDPTLATNYRPISLLCIISKVLERCIFNHCFQFLKSDINNIQHGFMQGRSTVTQLLTVYHDIVDILASGREVDVVHLDFSKAFDNQ